MAIEAHSNPIVTSGINDEKNGRFGSKIKLMYSYYYYENSIRAKTVHAQPQTIIYQQRQK